MPTTQSTPSLETIVATRLALLLTEHCCGPSDAGHGVRARKRILADMLHIATSIVSRELQTYVPAGLHQWLVGPRHRESPRAYARRAVRCLIARCAAAGVTCALRHDGAETVGMLMSYRPSHNIGAAVGEVSRIEGIVASCDDSPDASWRYEVRS